MFVAYLRYMAATVTVLTALAVLAVTVQAADLFTPVDESPPTLPAADLTLRSRVVTMDLEQVQRAQAAVPHRRRPARAPRPPAPRCPEQSRPPKPRPCAQTAPLRRSRRARP